MDIEISTRIENTYGEDSIVTTPTATVPGPTEKDWADDLDEWGYTHIFPLTGTDYPSSDDAFYDVVIIKCDAEPTLVGRTFDFGY